MCPKIENYVVHPCGQDRIKYHDRKLIKNNCHKKDKSEAIYIVVPEASIIKIRRGNYRPYFSRLKYRTLEKLIESTLKPIILMSIKYY